MSKNGYCNCYTHYLLLLFLDYKKRNEQNDSNWSASAEVNKEAVVTGEIKALGIYKTAFLLSQVYIYPGTKNSKQNQKLFLQKK